MSWLRSVTFSAGAHDRAAARRRDEAWLRETLSAPTTRVLAVRSASQLSVADGSHLGYLRVGELPAATQLTFLGLDGDGSAVFVFDAGEEPGEPAVAGAFAELRALAAALPENESAMAAQGVAMVGWHRRHRYCGVCGTLTVVEEAGHSRRCPSCEALHFPRTDPAVIMLVTSGEQCVLSRRRGARTGMWTALSGFVEPGETPEDAVAREVYEEVGLKVNGVTYRGAQPWPFPASLMLAFTADAEPRNLQIDEELEDARWFARHELIEGLRQGSLALPPSWTVSHNLIQAWLRDGTSLA
ncbi:MAG: NAD(+) diphosphatase [Chloroflexota bacterium]|nr:NAD(+) diphosphatase [Chloroflexota bacterium]